MLYNCVKVVRYMCRAYSLPCGFVYRFMNFFSFCLHQWAEDRNGHLVSSSTVLHLFCKTSPLSLEHNDLTMQNYLSPYACCWG